MKLTPNFMYAMINRVFPALSRDVDEDGKVTARKLRVKMNFAIGRTQEEMVKVARECEKQKQKLRERHIHHDADGNPIKEVVKNDETGEVSEGDFKFKSDEDRIEFHEELADLMTTPVDIRVHKVSMEYLPDPIERDLQEALSFMLEEYEITDDEEADEGDATDEP